MDIGKKQKSTEVTEPLKAPVIKPIRKPVKIAEPEKEKVPVKRK